MGRNSVKEKSRRLEIEIERKKVGKSQKIMDKLEKMYIAQRKHVTGKGEKKYEKGTGKGKGKISRYRERQKLWKAWKGYKRENCMKC